MSDSNKNIELLERNIVLLLNKLEENHYALKELSKKLEDSYILQKKISEENRLLKEANTSLDMANALLGSKTSNTKFKNKINTLIRQVDNCIIHFQNAE